jgi:hypothetical protein
MKRVFATFAATGMLALGVLAGTTATASAATVSPDRTAYGPFASGQDCEAFVWNANQWGNWDCEYVAGPYGGWYAFTP